MSSTSDAPRRGAAETSAMTVRDVLALPLVRRGIPQVVWGERHLGRRVRWAHVMELPDPSRLLRGGELVLTTGLGIGEGRARQRRWIDALAGQDAAALAVELGLTYRERLPAALVDACREHRLPLVTFGRRVRYVELTEAINSAILDRQAAVLRRADTLQEQLVSLLLDEQGVAEILELVAGEIGNPVVLEDPERELVYCATGGVTPDVAMRALDDLHRYERRGARNDGVFVVDLEGRGIAWGRIIALGIEAPLNDFQRAAVERGATAIALERVTHVQTERLRARSRGALLADLVAGRAGAQDAPRRAELLGFPARPAQLLPLAARQRRPRRPRPGDPVPPPWTDVASELRAGFLAEGLPALFGPHDPELLALVALDRGSEGDAVAAGIAERFYALLARHGLDDTGVALAIGAPADGWDEAGRGLRRAQRRAAGAVIAPPRRYYEAGTAGVSELLYDLRDSSELALFVREQLGPLLDDTSARGETLIETLRALTDHGGRKASAARALHIDRASLYPRLRQIEQRLGVDLDDSRTVLGLHVALEALLVLRSQGVEIG
jgi:purine catabolism regulator